MDIVQKFKETLSSVVPVMAIVLLLGVTVAPLGAASVGCFVAGGVLLIIGLTVFLLGVDIGILPIGERIGAALTAKRNLLLLLGASFVIGIMVTVAEPDVQVLADQIQGVAAGVSKWGLICMIAVGVGLFVMLGLLRTVLSLNLRWMLIICYVLLFALALSCPPAFQGVAFDAGGATTGPMTVPFIMALGVGVAAVRSGGQKHGSGSPAADDGSGSFGLTGIASIGPVAAVCVYGLLLRLTQGGGTAGAEGQAVQEAGQASPAGLGTFLSLVPEVTKEVSIALLPLVVMFTVFQLLLLRMPPVQVRRMVKGLAYSFVGLVLFLVGVNGGFMPVGEQLGTMLGGFAAGRGGAWTALFLGTGIVFGAVVVCAEPAVWVLTEQVETASGGNITRRLMLAALSAGVAIAIGLSMLRVLYKFSLWYILIPGYALALLLTFFCPPLFTGIAFDSGGVASGPMTSTFILSFTLGAAAACGGNPVTDAFGVIALVAMTPLIAIQVLGIIFRIKSRKAPNEKEATP